MKKTLLALYLGAFVIWFCGMNASAQTLLTDGLQGMNWANPTDNGAGAAWPSGMTGSETYAQAYAEGQTAGNAIKKAGGKAVRMPITSALAAGNDWAIYQGAIDGVNSTGIKVILCFWAASGNVVADTTTWYAMWDAVNAVYGNTMMVRYEPINEPAAYNDTDLTNLYAAFLSRYNPPDHKCILDGDGYAGNVVPIGADSRLTKQLLGLHSYSWFWDANGWQGNFQAMANAVGPYASRVVVTEIGVQNDNPTGPVPFWQQWGSNLRADQALLTGGLDWARVNGAATVAWSGIDNPDLYHWFYNFDNLTETNPQVSNMFRWSWNVGYNGQALTPAMGWSSWNHYGCSGLNENVIEQQASAMASSGMKAAGYTYINLDDCWMASSRDASGNLVPDPTNFPSGMPALVSYVHNLGLKIGLYEDVGAQTCDDGRPGSYGHYQQDANTFAAWGIDYIKMDWCNNSGLDPQTQYTQFSQALTAANANVVYSISDWGTKQPWSWAPAIANSWRTTPDISDNWLSMINNLEATSALAAFAGPGAWNDPDMLEVGNGGMTDTEYQTHFAMWAMLAAPLIAGNDLTNMSAATLATLTNSEVIAIDQDIVGAPGILLSDNGSGLQVWSRQVADGIVVALLNKSAASAVMTANWSDLGVSPSVSVDVRDVWNHVDLGTYTNGISTVVASHGVALLKLEAPSTLTYQTIATTPTQTVYESAAAANILSGGAVVEQCSYEWGYMCLDGNEAGYIGNGGTITLEDVNAPSAGMYNMTIYGMASGTRTYDVSVNGGAATPLTLTGTSFAIPSVTGTPVQLNAGNNFVELSNASAWAPDLDHLVFSAQATVAPDFYIASPIQNVTVSAGKSATVSLTLVPVGGFSGTVSIACTLPAAMAGATCPSTTATLGGGNPATVSLTITTAATQSLLQNQLDKTRMAETASLHSKPAPAPHPASEIFYAGVFPFSALTLLGAGVAFRYPGKKRLPFLLLFWIASVGILQIVACGGGGAASSNNNTPTCSSVPGTPAGLTAASTTSSGTTLVWTAASAGSNCTVSSYSVYQNSKLIGTTSNPSYVVSGLSAATTYSFTVVAQDSFGVSASSAALSVTTGAAIYDVTVTATSGSITQNAGFQVTVQ